MRHRNPSADAQSANSDRDARLGEAKAVASDIAGGAEATVGDTIQSVGAKAGEQAGKVKDQFSNDVSSDATALRQAANGMSFDSPKERTLGQIAEG